MILEYCPKCCRMTETRFGHCLDCGLARRVFTAPKWPRPMAKVGAYLVGGFLLGGIIGPCIGCASRTDVELVRPNVDATSYEARISPTFDVPSTLNAAIAIDDWQVTTGVIITTSITDDPCPAESACFHIAPQDQPMTSKDCSNYEPGIIGCTYDSGHEIAVAATLDDGTQLHVMRHEMGHALGLHHTVELDSVMYYTTGGSATITGVDVAQYDWLRGGPAGGFELDTEH